MKNIIRNIKSKFFQGKFTDNNKSFYDSSTPFWLQSLSEIKGLDNDDDLENIKPILKRFFEYTEDAHLLEVGCGYGRVASWFKNNFKNINYYGLDFSQQCISYCNENYQSENIHFILSNILKYRYANKYDIVIWLWSGFYEISNKDKQAALMNIFYSMKEDAVLILDLPKEICGEEKLIYKSNAIIEQHSNFGFVKNQVLSKQQLSKMISESGFTILQEVAYKTKKGFPRYSLIIQK